MTRDVIEFEITDEQWDEAESRCHTNGWAIAAFHCPIAQGLKGAGYPRPQVSGETRVHLDLFRRSERWALDEEGVILMTAFDEHLPPPELPVTVRLTRIDTGRPILGHT